MRPTIVFYGNCAAGILRNFFAGFPDLSEEFDIWWIRSFEKHLSLDRLRDIMGRCAIYAQQVAHSREGWFDKIEDARALLPVSCRTVRFPPLILNSLWPFVVPDPRNRPSAICHEGPYPAYLGNRLILDLLREETCPERVLDKFLEIKIADVCDPGRIHELSLNGLRRLEQKTDVAISGFIDARFRTERLFLMPIHPTGALCRELCRLMAACLELPLPHSELARRLSLVGRHHGVGSYDAPIHPQIAAFFGLEWADGLLYRHHEDGRYSFEDFMLRYIKFEHTPEYFEGVAHAKRGLWAAAERCFRTAVTRNDRSAAYHALLGRSLVEQGRTAEAVPCCRRAVGCPWPTAEHWLALGRVLETTDALDEAAAALRAGLAAAPDDGELPLALARLLDRTGDPAEAERLRALAAENRRNRLDPPLLEADGAVYGRYWLDETGADGASLRPA